MTDDKNNIEIRSEEVQEIMGTPPKWIIRWGIVIIMSVVFILLAGSFFYKYPDKINARVTIISESPPIQIIARQNGKLDKIFVIDKQSVKAGDLLGIIENPADYKDVYSLIDYLDSIKSFFDDPDSLMNLELSGDYNLGQIHTYYSTLVSQLNEFQTYIRFNPSDQKIKSLENEYADYKNYIEKLRRKIEVLNQDYILSVSQFLRDSVLHVNKVMSDVDFEKSKQSMFKQKYSYNSATTDLASTQITMNKLTQDIEEQKRLKSEMVFNQLIALRREFTNLNNQLITWEQDYVLKTPIAGQVTFTNFWSVNQFVNAGEMVFTVVPENELEIIGKATIPIAGVGKVDTAQSVNIKLDNFPYMEFGILEAEVSNISMVPVTTKDGSYYTAEIKLRNGLVTNYKKELPFNQEMQGNAEIITKDRRLIERLVEPLVSVFHERF